MLWAAVVDPRQVALPADALAAGAPGAATEQVGAELILAMSRAEEPRGDRGPETVPMGKLADAISAVVARKAAQLLALSTDEGRASEAAQRTAGRVQVFSL